MLKISAISLVLRTREITHIFKFSTHSMKYIWYSPQKSRYPLYIFIHFSQNPDEKSYISAKIEAVKHLHAVNLLSAPPSKQRAMVYFSLNFILIV